MTNVIPFPKRYGASDRQQRIVVSRWIRAADDAAARWRLCPEVDIVGARS